MVKSPKTPAPFPSRDEVLEFIRESRGNVGKREIARAFHLNAEQKRELKKLLRELTLDGSLQKGRGRRFASPGQLPEVLIVQVSGLDADGEPVARPMNWDEDEGPPPVIHMLPERRGQPALGVGDRILARLSKTGERHYEAKTIRRIAGAPATVLGLFDVVDGVGRIRPTDRRAKSDFTVRTGDHMGAKPGDLVRAEIMPGRRLGLRQAKVVERIDGPDDLSAVSLIALHEQGIPDVFSPEALAEAEKAGPAALDRRTDLRAIPLVTIDGADARDFDDAVWAEPDAAPDNPGGWHVLVAIADVAWYVRPGKALNRDARDRGNSVYFPDRVVPMLPEALSNGWCSLVPGEDRPCMAVHMWIDSAGNLRRHTFVRGLMRSTARLTYEQVQAAYDGVPDDVTDALVEPVITPLYGAFGALLKNREARPALDLDLPERRVVIADDGTVESIRFRDRLDSHRLIEEFMIAANVAAAETLERLGQHCMYRVHDQPSREKLQALDEFLKSLNMRFRKGQVTTPLAFNQILKQTADTPESHMVNAIILRSQAQAEYSPTNIGHFGLALRRYAHFTSPIRRYADLMVHRALITGLNLGQGGLGRETLDYEETGAHLSATERRAATAERSAVDRFTAGFLAAQIGASFPARINGVTRAGLFVTLEETGADGLVPIRTLPDDYYIHDERSHALTGETHGQVYRMGQKIEVRLEEAMPITGGLIFSVLGLPGGKSRANRGHRPSGRRRRSHKRARGAARSRKGRRGGN